ncbi:MAG: DUF4340 domain-containing protein [Bryobacteraceae bacterium]|nr:DUF4340 domain-containing protein [Bryobacteraceae bacterium]MDW8378768.1 DUF4340 domain-containing protein [Bryobacterales bacterium]
MKKEEEKKGSPDTPKILSIPEDQITQLEIKRKDGKNTTLKKGDKWQIVAPETLAVDQDVVNSMLSSVSSLTADRVVEENATDLATFGLQAPTVEVVVTQKDGKSTRLVIGDETATGSGYFAKLGSENKVYTIGSYIKSSLDKTTQEIRDKRLLAFDSDKLTRVELIAKGAPIEFGKNSQNEWQIVKPKPSRADNWGVEELVRKIKDAKMDTNISEEDTKKAQTSFATGTKIAIARLTDASGTHEIEVRKKDNDYFAKGSALPGIYKVTTELGEGLNKGLDDFRNKKVFDFGFSDPSRIEVKIGADSKVYQKSGEKWMLGNQQMDSVSVQSFVDKLRDLSAASFSEGTVTNPALEIRLTAKEGKLVDHVLIAPVGTGAHAIRQGEPTIYVLGPGVLEDLKKAAGEIKPHASEKKDEKKDEKKK